MLQAVLYGRLGKDAQAIPTKSGNPMTAANVAVDVSPRDTDSTIWVRVIAFGKVAEALARHAKGETLAAAGRLELTKWTADDGTERESWQMVADTVQSARTVRPNAGAGGSKGNGGTAKRSPKPDPSGSLPFDDHIPF